MPPKIITQGKREVGQEFNAVTELLTHIGSVFSLFSGGERYGTARVIGDNHHDSRYTSEKHGGGKTNMADHNYRFRVETSNK